MPFETHEAHNLAPILSLPSDIIYQILWILSDGWITLDPTADAWNLTQVCSRWRRTTLEFHNLWSRINIDRDDISKYSLHAVAILRTILERSVNSHLRLRVYADMLLVHANLLDLLTAHYRRWYDLDLEISMFLLNSLSAQMGILGFPELRRLRLSLPDDHVHIPNLNVFERCPNLETVNFESIPRCVSLQLPWARLRSVVLKERVQGDFLRILTSASGLLSCELISVQPSLAIVEPAVSLPVKHEALQSLILRCIPSAVVLDGLVLPSLDRIVLDNTAQLSFPYLTSFLRRSKCDLQSLTLSGSLFLDSGLRDVLEITPFVTELVLEDWTPYKQPSPFDALFTSLVDDSDSCDNLLPRLRTLVLRNLSRNIVDLHLLAEMIESRSRPGAKCASIKSVSVHGDLRLIKNKGSIDRIRALQAQGLKICVSGPKRA